MVRKVGILSGLLAFLMSIIAEIPIYPPNNIYLNFKIFTFMNLDHYLWGYINNLDSTVFSQMLMQFPENIISIVIWCLCVFIGISSISASINKTKYQYAFRLYYLNILFSAFLLTIYTIIIVFLIWGAPIFFFYLTGIGYYVLILILVLNILALISLKKSS